MLIAIAQAVIFIVSFIGSGFLIHWVISGLAGYSVGTVYHWIALCFVIWVGYAWRAFMKWESKH